MPKLLSRVALVFLLLTAKDVFAADSTFVFKEADIRVDIPGAVWHLRPKFEKNGFVIYTFKRDPVVDSAGNTIDFVNAVGYMGTYTTTETFPQLEAEFKKILKSIRK